MNAVSPGNDLELELRVRNARLMNVMREHDIPNMAQLAKQSGVHYNSIHALFSFRKKPITANGDWTAPAKQLADFFSTDPSELFPEHLRRVQMKSNRSHIQIDSQVVSPIDTDSVVSAKLDVEKLLKGLSPRKQKVLMMRHGLGGYGEHSLKEIGKSLGVSTERVRQLEAVGCRNARDYSQRLDSSANMKRALNHTVAV